MWCGDRDRSRDRDRDSDREMSESQTLGSVSRPSVPESTSFQSSLSSLVELISSFSMVHILPHFVKM